MRQRKRVKRIKIAILILEKQKLWIFVVLLFVWRVSVTHNQSAPGFQTHFKSLLKDNVWKAADTKTTVDRLSAHSNTENAFKVDSNAMRRIFPHKSKLAECSPFSYYHEQMVK